MSATARTTTTTSRRTRTRLIASTVGVAVVVGLGLGTAVSASDPPPPALVGRAVLPAETVSDGPPSGALAFGNAIVNGIQFPRPRQAVAGFSAIVEAKHGQWLAMPDNGFGAKANSGDFLIRAYFIEPHFKTAEGGTGDVAVGTYIQFSDPDGKFTRPDGTVVTLTRADRLLTGADIDPESLQVGSGGDLWVGDEFGPWILHFDRTGRLLERPIAMPDGITSPNNPWVIQGRNTVGNSRGLEAMGISGKHLYPMLEGPLLADPDQGRRLMYEYDTHRGAFTGQVWQYRVDNPAYLVSDIAPLDPHRLVVMERDGGRGLNAVYRRVYVVDLRDVDTNGFLVKRQVLDLAAIPDPAGVSLPERHAGDVGLGNPFRVTCESVEAIRVVRKDQVLVGCDNNLPNTGRNPARADDNELIVVDVPTLSER